MLRDLLLTDLKILKKKKEKKKAQLGDVLNKENLHTRKLQI